MILLGASLAVAARVTLTPMPGVPFEFPQSVQVDGRRESLDLNGRLEVAKGAQVLISGYRVIRVSGEQTAGEAVLYAPKSFSLISWPFSQRKPTGVSVAIARHDSNWNEAATIAPVVEPAPDGAVAWMALPEGEWDLALMVRGFEPAFTTALQVKSDRVLDPSSTLTPGGGVVARIRSSNTGSVLEDWSAFARCRGRDRDPDSPMQRFFDQRPIARGGKSLEFRSLPLAQCELRVVVPKLSATRVPIVPLTAAGPTDLKDVFVSAAGAARITLSFPEGAPEGGVRVSILRKTGDFPGPDDEVVSVKELLAPGKDARLDLRKLDPGLVVIAISGISTDLYRTVDASIRPDILTEVAVTLDPIVVRGTVTRGKSPVEVAKLELVQTKKVASATSDKDGLYRLLVWTSGVYMLLTTPPAENFAFPETLDVENTAEVEHDVVLPFSSIMGTVTDKETGAPIPKARLTASPAEEGEVGFSFGVDSDDEGSYRFGNLTDRVLKIKVEAEGYSSESFDSVRPAEGGTRLDVTLSGGLTLRGQVVDDVGRPIAGAFVGLDSDSTDSVFSRRTETSGDGSFSFDGLRRGGHLLVVHRCGYRMGVRALDLMPSTEQLQLALSTASVSITFRFRDDRNRPVPRVAVGVSVDGRHLPREYPSQFSMGCGLSPFSDGDGLLRVDLLPLGSLEILVGAEQRPAGSIVNEGFERSFDLTIASGLP